MQNWALNSKASGPATWKAWQYNMALNLQIECHILQYEERARSRDSSANVSALFVICETYLNCILFSLCSQNSERNIGVKIWYMSISMTFGRKLQTICTFCKSMLVMSMRSVLQQPSRQETGQLKEEVKSLLGSFKQFQPMKKSQELTQL